jgi:hypothetical protein
MHACHAEASVSALETALQIERSRILDLRMCRFGLEGSGAALRNEGRRTLGPSDRSDASATSPCGEDKREVMGAVAAHGAQLACAIAPALVLLGTLLAVYLFPAWLGYGLGRAVSTEASVFVTPDPIRALSLTLFASILTVPGVAIAIYARDWVLRTVKTMYGLDPKKLTRVEKSINSMVRIGAAILAIVVVAR